MPYKALSPNIRNAIRRLCLERRQKMDAPKILIVLSFLEKRLRDRGLNDSGFPLNEKVHKEDMPQAVGYVLSLIPKIRGMIVNRDLLSATRQLGFIQGVLWIAGIITLKKIKELDHL